MSKKVTYMSECPESNTIYLGASYGVFALGLLPYLLFWLTIDNNTNYSRMVWFDIGLHMLHFVVSVSIFFAFLRDSFLEVQIHTGKVLKAAGVGAVVMIVLALVITFAGVLLQNTFLAVGTLPLTELHMFGLPEAIIHEQPIVGTLTVAILTPFTISCLYYATVFAPLYNKWPVLSYVILAAVVALPRAVYALTFWNGTEELILYLIQLPVHLIACTLYRKTDTIWVPIFTLMGANAVMCMIQLF